MKKRKKVKERKEEVFLAICQIIAEEGLSGVSTTEVAKKLGVSQPAIYKYFKNKDEMIIYFLKHLGDQLRGILSKANERKTSKEKIRTIYEEHFKLIERTKVLPRVVFSDTIFTAKGSEKIKALRDVIYAYKEGIKKIIEEGIKRGEIVSVDPEVGARVIIGSILSTTLMWMLSKKETGLTQKVDELMTFLDSTFFTRSCNK